MSDPIRSEFADDEDFGELLEMFVGEIPSRREGLQLAHAQDNVEQLKTLSHQLKGAGGGYGYPGLSEVAADLETACKENDKSKIDTGFELVTNYLDRITL